MTVIRNLAAHKPAYYVPPRPFLPPLYTSESGLECHGTCTFAFHGPGWTPEKPYVLKFRSAGCTVKAHHA